MELTKCESQVMTILWSADYDMALPEIMDLVNHRYQKKWKPQTVSTFLTRLVKKKALNMYRQGRSFLYHPLISRDEAWKELLSELVDIWCEKDPGILQKDVSRYFTPDK
ncbi:BlaI/MecI/CopY family transcriptional regulator [Hominifimenecus sp. rT4P-3]|uniref:BlaI/MecI/CopY family transcriptional regulator n=1 Tax=Hominifimenecus sp. rT4P-3 TaxID=3242979 RepID=UPI003DA394D2